MLLLPWTLLLADCIRVDADRIPVSSLAARVPALAPLASLDFGLSPVPGVRRDIRAPELNAFLRRHGVANAAAAEERVCVEREATPLDPQEIVAAMHKAWPADREIRIEVLEFSNRAFAPGSLEFRAATLPVPMKQDAAVIWRGSHRDARGGLSPVWARVKLSEKTRAMIATRPLPAGTAIAEGAVEWQEAEEFPRATLAVMNREDAEGWIPRRAIRAGQRVDPAWLDPPAAVTRGEAVTVEVIQEGLRLSLTGRAAGTARVNQKVAVTMPLSKKTFQAVVKEKGHATIEVPTPRR